MAVDANRQLELRFGRPAVPQRSRQGQTGGNSIRLDGEEAQGPRAGISRRIMKHGMALFLLDLEGPVHGATSRRPPLPGALRRACFFLEKPLINALEGAAGGRGDLRAL